MARLDVRVYQQELCTNGCVLALISTGADVAIAAVRTDLAKIGYRWANQRCLIEQAIEKVDSLFLLVAYEVLPSRGSHP